MLILEKQSRVAEQAVLVLTTLVNARHIVLRTDHHASDILVQSQLRAKYLPLLLTVRTVLSIMSVIFWCTVLDWGAKHHPLLLPALSPNLTTDATWCLSSDSRAGYRAGGISFRKLGEVPKDARRFLNSTRNTSLP